MPQPTLLIKDFSVTEGQEAIFIIGVTAPITDPNSLRLTINNGSATSPNDFDVSNLQISTDGVNFQPFVNGSLASIATGKDCIYIKVPTIDDNLMEHVLFSDTESFTLTAEPVSGIDGGTVVETASIIDNDIQRISVVSNGDKLEGEYASWTVSVDKDSNYKWSWAKFDLVDETTQRGVDYDPSTLQVSIDNGITWSNLAEGNDFGFAFKPGLTSAQVRVKTGVDNVADNGESLRLRVTPNLEGSEHLAPDVVSAAVTINEAPANVPPSLLIQDFTVTEGQDAIFIIGVTAPINGPNTLKLTVNNGSATAPNDFSLSGLLISTDGVNFQPFVNGSEVSIAQGKDCIYVKAPVIDDNLVEHNLFTDKETFTITATPITGLSGGTVVETASIIDNDIQRISVVGNGDKIEGDYATWTVSVDKDTAEKWSWAKYELVDGTTQRSIDYDPSTLEFSNDGGNTWAKLFENDNFGFAFKPGETSIQVRVKTIDDTTLENVEALTLKVTPNTEGLEHLAPDVAQATVNILDNDQPLTPTAKIVSVTGSEVIEGGKAVFTIKLADVNSLPSSITLAPIDDTAKAGEDFTLNGAEISFDGGTNWATFDGLNVQIAGNATEFKVRYNTLDDTLVEPTESYKLTATTNGSSGTGVATILDNDQPLTPTAKIGSVTGSEVIEGGKAVFTVKLADVNSLPSSITLTPIDDTAKAGEDFTLNGAEISFDGGNNWATFDGLNVQIAGNATEFKVRYNTLDDNLVEPAESYKLTATTNGSSGTGVATILDNDKVAPKVSLVGTNNLLEGGEKGQYVVKLDSVSDVDRVFTIRIDNGTAQRFDGNGAGQDFVWGGAYDISSIGKVFFGRVPNDNYNGYNNRAAVGPAKGDASWDYSVYNSQGQINQGNTITVKVAAGQSTSEAFSIQAWKEKVTVDQDYWNPNGLNKTNAKEGTEKFSLTLVDAQGLEVTTGKVDVSITDKSPYVFVSPIAIDLNGDGIQTVSVDAGVQFDILNSGKAVNTGWISGGDGFLAVDSNGNGSIDNRSELFGGQVGEGFDKLASFDSNQDGVVNNQDNNWGKLSIWQDGNVNGVTDAGELGSLESFGIAALNVAHTKTFTQDAQGNILGEQSTAITNTGSSVEMIDVYFRVQS